MAIGKQIGFLTSLSLVMGIVIGGGILVLPSAVAQYGKWGFWAWPIASIAVLNLAFMFGFLSKKHSDASGPASFTQKYFGNCFGFQIAWAHWIALCMGTFVVSISFTSYLSAALGISNDYSFLLSLGMLWCIVILKALCTLISLRALVVITTIKIITLTTVILYGSCTLNLDLLSHPVKTGMPDGFGGLLGALALVLFAFVGIESATLPGENVKNASKTIPLATVIGTVVSAILFTGTYAVVFCSVPYEQLLHSNAPVADAMNLLAGSSAEKIISILAMIGCIGSINGCLFATSHILRSSAQAGWFPEIFTRMTSACFPIYSGLLSAIVVSCVICLYYAVGVDARTLVRNGAAQLEVFLIAIVYLVSCMAYKMAGGKKIAWALGVLSCAGFLFGAMPDYLSACLGIMTFFSGVVVYTAFSHKMRGNTGIA